MNLNINPSIDVENYGAALTVNADIGEFTITSITASRSWSQENYRDNDQTQLPFAWVQKENRDAESFSQEFRLSSPVKERYDYILGLYYFETELDDNSGDFRTFSNSPYAIDFNDADNYVKNENAAVFGHLNFRATDQLTLFGGFRYLKDKIAATLLKRAYRQNNPFLGDGVIMDRSAGPISNSGDESKLVGKLGAQFEASDNLMFYASASTGYKGQAFNTDFKFDPVTFLTVEPVRSEESEALEAGFRSLLADERLQLNVTVFRTDFENIQQTIRNLAINRNTVGNVPEVRSQGLEIEAIFVPTSSLTIRGGATFLDATYESFANTPNGVDLSGRELPNAPDRSFVLDVRQEFTLRDNLDAFLQVKGRYQSEINHEILLNPEGIQEGYGIVNLSLGLLPDSGGWEVVLFANNLLDEQYMGSSTINGGAGGDLGMHVLPRDFERYIGSRISFNF